MVREPLLLSVALSRDSPFPSSPPSLMVSSSDSLRFLVSLSFPPNEILAVGETGMTGATVECLVFSVVVVTVIVAEVGMMVVVSTVEEVGVTAVVLLEEIWVRLLLSSFSSSGPSSPSPPGSTP